EASVGREDTEERRMLIKQKRDVSSDLSLLQSQLGALQKFNPETIAQKKKAMTAAYDAVNRWTDNTFQLRKYLINTMYMDKKQVNQMLQMEADFDNVEPPTK
ncbi:meiotic nuclear division protein 1, partial [Kipferlia bialata]